MSALAGGSKPHTPSYKPKLLDEIEKKQWYPELNVETKSSNVCLIFQCTMNNQYPKIFV